MAERSQSINVEIADRKYPFNIKSEEEEEIIRKVADKIKANLLILRSKFANKDVQDFMVMIAIQYAIRLSELEDKYNRMGDGHEEILSEVLKRLQTIDLGGKEQGVREQDL